MDEQLDAILSSGVPDDLDTWSNDELRRRRTEDEAIEAAVSYARRVLQGRLDILRAELERRRDDSSGSGADDLLARLPAVLAGDHVATTPGRARATSLSVPDAADALVARIDADLGETALANLDAQDADHLAELVGRLERHESELSAARFALFARIDAMRDELAARYKDGRADVADLLR